MLNFDAGNSSTVLKYYFMKRVPLFYSSDEDFRDLVLSTRSDKLGKIMHCVEYLNNDGSRDYVMFEKLTSVLDFIHSNFK